MQIGQVILTSIMILILFDVLDAPVKILRIRKSRAVIALLCLVIGGFWNIALGNSAVNVGGTVVPGILFIMLAYRQKRKSLGWSILTLGFSAIGGYFAYRFLPEILWLGLSSVYAVGIVCGVLSLLLGRSVENVVIGSLISTQVSFVLVALEELLRGGYAMINAGVGAEYDAMVISLMIGTFGFCAVKRLSASKHRFSEYSRIR